MYDFIQHMSKVIDERPFEVFGAAILLLVIGILFIPVLIDFAKRIKIIEKEDDQ